MNNPIQAYKESAAKLDTLLHDNGGKVVGESLVDITTKLLEIVEKEGLFLRDTVTGLCKSCLTTDQTISPSVAKTLWLTHFKDRIRRKMATTDGESFRLKPLTTAELDLLWDNIYMYATYNSRKELYDAIPEWDGVSRIRNFMRDYFYCDANPNFFLLFLTAIVGMMDDPEKTYCPFFFDFVGDEKGTGKSSLPEHLIGRHAVMLSMTARPDDFFVNAYDSNAIIVIDDESKWTDPKSFNSWSYDQFKSYVTQRYDKFSRKYQQPEEHARSFIIVRTSNESTTVFSPNERRQIIFKIGLPERMCLHWKLDQNYMNQMLAEAKAYYVEHGMYQVTDEDWGDIDKQNMENFNYDTDDYQTLLKFVTYMYEKPNDTDAYTVRVFGDNGRWISWRGYNQWRKDNHETAIASRRFHRLMQIIAQNYPSMISYPSKAMKLQDVNTLIRAAKVKPKDTSIIETANDIPDMEF